MAQVFEHIDSSILPERYGGTYRGEYTADHCIDMEKDARKAAIVDALVAKYGN